jgi:hypothetical protein
MRCTLQSSVVHCLALRDISAVVSTCTGVELAYWATAAGSTINVIQAASRLAAMLLAQCTRIAVHTVLNKSCCTEVRYVVLAYLLSRHFEHSSRVLCGVH